MSKGLYLETGQTFDLCALLWVTSALCNQSSDVFEDATLTNAEQVFVPPPINTEGRINH